MNNLIYDCNNKNGITPNVLKAGILKGEFLTAWYLVAVYVFKLKILNYHKKMMSFQKRYDNTLIIGGRGLGKSCVLVQAYVLTIILRNPNIRIGLVSANFRQALSFLSGIKKKFEAENDVIFELFGDLRGDIWQGDKIAIKRTKIEREGCLNCGGMGGASLTGGHYNLLILDDALVQENSGTKLQREKFKNFWESTLVGTVIQKETINGKEIIGKIKIIGTFYNPQDFYTELLEKYNTNKEKAKFKVQLNPSLIYKNGSYVSACPAIKSTQYLLDLKNNMDSHNFKMQFMAEIEGSNSPYFKPEYFQFFYKKGEENKKYYIYIKENDKYIKREVKVYMGVDLAISQTENADRFSLSVIGVDNNKNVYLLDGYAGRHTFLEQQNIIKYFYKKYPMCVRIGIDSTAYQVAMPSELLRTTDLPISKIKLTKKKEDRIIVFSAKWENYKVFIYKDINGSKNNFLELLQEECYNFPNHPHDDTIDSFCMAWELSQNFNNNNNDDENNIKLLSSLFS